MPRSTKSSKPSAKRRLDFDESNASSKIPKVEQEDGDEEITEAPSSTTPAVVEGTPQKRKRGGDSYFSPVASRKNKSAVVTPEKAEAATSTKKIKTEKQEDKEAYVPVYIHKNIGYQRRGQASISDELKKTFALVEEHYEIPADFETNKAYGPLSGTCFEERAVDAYNHGWLKSLSSETAVDICSHCAVTGHKREDCPELL